MKHKPGWKRYAEVLGIAGVIGSLVFVAIEIQQNTNAVRSATIQAIAALSVDTTLRLTENPELRAARRACNDEEELTQDQQQLVIANFTALMRLQQNRYLQMQLGVLDEETVFQMGGRGPAYRSACFARFWSENGENFPIEFRRFLEREVIRLSAPSE